MSTVPSALPVCSRRQPSDVPDSLEEGGRVLSAPERRR